ncbi:MAG: hypothetical protein HY686_05125 [Chloroflexi bacterium]|nr:hypothetical protein [Chloroflexota bacterium]
MQDQPRVLLQRSGWQLIGGAFGLYRRRFWPFLALSAIYGTALTLANIIAILFPTTINGAVAVLVGGMATRVPVPLWRVWGAVLRRLPSLVGAFFLYGLVMLGLAITVVGIPLAIYFGVLWALAPQAVMLEGCGPRAALAASARWVRGSWWRVFWLHLLMVFLYLGVLVVASLVIERGILTPLLGPTPSLQESAVADLLLRLSLSLLLNLPVSILLTPVYPILAALLYLDLRARKDGYTREALRRDVARALGASPGGPLPGQGEP